MDAVPSAKRNREAVCLDLKDVADVGQPGQQMYSTSPGGPSAAFNYGLSAWVRVGILDSSVTTAPQILGCLGIPACVCCVDISELNTAPRSNPLTNQIHNR